MTELSTATLSVLDAYWKADPKSTEHTDAYEVAGIAAALRAVAEIVAPLEIEKVWKDGRWEGYEKLSPTREKLFAIAAELEAPPNNLGGTF